MSVYELPANLPAPEDDLGLHFQEPAPVIQVEHEHHAIAALLLPSPRNGPANPGDLPGLERQLP